MRSGSFWQQLSLGVGAFALAAVAYCAPFVYVTQPSMNQLSVIDAANNAVTATIPVGHFPTGVAINHAATRAYVANTSSDTISVIDLATNTVIGALTAPGFPQAIALDERHGRLYVGNRGPSTVSVIDIADGSMVATIPLTDRPTDIAIHPDGSRVFVLYDIASTLSVVDTGTNAIVGTLPNDPTVLPTAFVLNPAGTRLYVAHWATRSVFPEPPGTDVVTVIDTAGLAPTLTIHIGRSVLGGIAIDANRGRYYVTTAANVLPFDGGITILDVATNAVVGTAPMPYQGGGVSLGAEPITGHVFVPNYSMNLVTVIDGPTASVLATIPVSGPSRVAVGPSAALPSMEPIPTVSHVLLAAMAFSVLCIAWYAMRRPAPRRRPVL